MHLTWLVLLLYFTGCFASNLKQIIETDDIISKLNHLIERLGPQEISDNITTDDSEMPTFDLPVALQDWFSNFQNNITEFLKETISEQTEILKQEAISQPSIRQQTIHKQRTNVTTCPSVPVGAVCLTTGVYIFHVTHLNWGEARRFCLSKGMDLVAIESAEENAALADYGKTSGIAQKRAWTSGCYQNQFSNFAWHSVDKNFTYVNWWSGYPVTKVPGNCILFYPADPRWWEEPQPGSYPSICEL